MFESFIECLAEVFITVLPRVKRHAGISEGEQGAGIPGVHRHAGIGEGKIELKNIIFL